MGEATNPFQIAPFYLTSHRRTFTEYEANGTPKQPLGYVTRAEYNFDQEEGGGNWYYNLPGTGVFEGNGRVICRSQSSFHAPEYWRDEVDDDNAKYTQIDYGMVLITLTLSRRFEDHIPFKGITFTWMKVKKEKVVTEQEFDLVPPRPNTSDGWSSTPGQIVETERSEEEVTITFQLPDDYEQGKHDFDSNRDLTQDKLVSRGFVYPGAGGSFHDGSEKYGYDERKEVTDVKLYPLPPPDETLKYEVIKKKTVTTITYKTQFFNDVDEVDETCAPAPFFKV